jgi:hypothetical protein
MRGSNKKYRICGQIAICLFGAVNYDILNLIRVGMLSICDRSIFGFLANYQGKFSLITWQLRCRYQAKIRPSTRAFGIKKTYLRLTT